MTSSPNVDDRATPSTHQDTKREAVSHHAMKMALGQLAGFRGCARLYTSTHQPMRTTQSTTFTVRLAEAAKSWLEALARSTGRTRSQLAAEAIDEFLEDNESQVACISTVPGGGRSC